MRRVYIEAALFWLFAVALVGGVALLSATCDPDRAESPPPLKVSIEKTASSEDGEVVLEMACYMVCVDPVLVKDSPPRVPDKHF